MAYDKVIDSVKLDADIKKVCDAIRTKSESSAKLTFPIGMVDAINGISTGGGTGGGTPQIKHVTLTDNGTYSITPNEGKTLAKVEVTVNVPVSSGGSGNKNCEAIIVVPPNKPKFKGTSGPVKLWGWGQGKSPSNSTWNKPSYLFVGSGYTEYIGGEETPLSLSVNLSGQVTGIPELLEGKYLATLGI